MHADVNAAIGAVFGNRSAVEHGHERIVEHTVELVVVDAGDILGADRDVGGAVEPDDGHRRRCRARTPSMMICTPAADVRRQVT